MIGIFDSGVGGLTVVRALRSHLPSVPVVYFGDTARTPYGNKSEETIRRFAHEDAAFVIGQGATMLVVACNTMSAVALAALRERFSSVPIFDVISPAVEAAQADHPSTVAVIGTRATVNSGIYKRQLQEKNTSLNVVELACPLFVPLVEEGMIDAAETRGLVRHYLAPLSVQKPETLILGCTHYPFLNPVIQQEIGNGVRVIDSADVTAQKVATFVAEHPEVMQSQKTALYFSDLPPHTRAQVRSWMGEGFPMYHVPIERIERFGNQIQKDARQE